MRIRSDLSGTEVELQFYAEDDLQWSEHARERQPESWIRFTLHEDEARALLIWLQGNRATDYRSSRLTVRGSSDWLVVEGAGSTFVICLGNRDLVASFAREVTGTLNLITGHAVDPSA